MALRVLIAEDEMVVALALCLQLESLGYEVAGIAGNGWDAVEFARREQPDVVLMDIRMPEMDGLSATRALMEESPRPIILVTGNAGHEAAAEEAGAMALVAKPLVREDLPAIIREAQRRFVRFLLVREECDSGPEALTAWHTCARGSARAGGTGAVLRAGGLHAVARVGGDTRDDAAGGGAGGGGGLTAEAARWGAGRPVTATPVRSGEGPLQPACVR